MLNEEIKKHNKEVKSKTDFNKKNKSLTKTILSKMKDEKVITDFYFDKNFILINGECMTVMNYLINKDIVVNHIITDIPYGTVQGLSIEGWKNKGNVPTWDYPIDIKEMIDACFKISASNSNMILFSQEPMTFKINYELCIYQKYTLSNKMIWVKNNHANGFSAKTNPLNYYEEMLLIRKSLDESNSLEIRKYFKDMLAYCGNDRKAIMDKLGQGLDHCFRYANRTFYIPTETNYKALIKEYQIDKMKNFIEYNSLKEKWDKENKVIFNIPDGEKIVKNVFEYKKDQNNIHPTQKPIALLEKLITIFSNEEDTILDFTCGSASTGIAAVKNNRKFIGIELNETFYKDALTWYKKTKKEQTNEKAAN